MKTLLFGIAGGSGSGKTSLAYSIAEQLGREKVLVISVDSYYRDLHHLTPEERDRVNFDNPNAIDWPLLRRHVRALLARRAVPMPNYSFADHLRSGATTVHPKDVIIIEGIFALLDDELCRMMTMRIYVETPADVRLARRMARDIAERQRDAQSILDQWSQFVRPAHETFIGPSARKAHVIIPEDPEGGMREIAGHLIQSTIRDFYASQKLRLLYGANEVKLVFEQIIAAGQPNYVLDSEGQFAQHMPDVAAWFTEQVRERGIPIRLITRRHRKQHEQSYSEKRYIRKSGASHAVLNIFADNVAIIIWDKIPQAVLINDRTVANSLRSYFDVLWQHATIAK